MWSLYYDIFFLKHKRHSRKNGECSFVFETSISGRPMTREEKNMPEEHIVDVDLWYSEVPISKQRRLSNMIF